MSKPALKKTSSEQRIVSTDSPPDVEKRRRPFVYGLISGFASALAIFLMIVQLTVGMKSLRPALVSPLTPIEQKKSEGEPGVIFISPEAADAQLTKEQCSAAIEYYTLWSKGNFLGALAILETSPPNPWVLKEKANCKIAMYRMDDAHNDLHMAADLAFGHLFSGDTTYLGIWEAVARKRIKIFREEEEVLKEAKRLTDVLDRVPEVWHLVGLCYWYLASSLQDQANQSDILSVDERRNRIQRAEQYWKDAELAYKNANERGSKNFWTWLDYINCRTELGAGPDEVSREFIEVMKKFPDNLEVEARFRLRLRPQEFGTNTAKRK